MLPDRIRAAANRAREAAAPLSPTAPAGDPGELAVVSSPGVSDGTPRGGRIAAVVRRDDEAEIVMVQLATNETEQATDLDLVLQPNETGMPFEVVVQGELYGPVFTDQLLGAVGWIDDVRLAAVTDALLTDGESLEAFAIGPPLTGPDDPRRAFKQHELGQLEQLVSACREWLSGAPAPSRTLDPELLLPPPPGTDPGEAADQFIELLDLIVEMDTATLGVDIEMVALLSDTDLLDEMQRWRTEFGMDAARVLTSFTIVDAEDLPQASPSDSAPSQARRGDAVLQPLLAAHAEAGRVVTDVFTNRRCWGAAAELRVVRSREGRTCRGRACYAEAV